MIYPPSRVQPTKTGMTPDFTVATICQNSFIHNYWNRNGEKQLIFGIDLYVSRINPCRLIFFYIHAKPKRLNSMGRYLQVYFKRTAVRIRSFCIKTSNSLWRNMAVTIIQAISLIGNFRQRLISIPKSQLKSIIFIALSCSWKSSSGYYFEPFIRNMVKHTNRTGTVFRKYPT